MKKDQLDELFEELQGHFDIELPEEGHEARFRKRLEGKTDVKHSRSPRIWMAIAASLVILLGLGIFYTNSTPSREARISEISPEASSTQLYFASVIEEQVKQLEAEENPQTKALIEDALVELAELEEDYRKLEQDLLNGGNSKLILSAMITNFQTRIELLNDVLNTIESIKEFNINSNEEYTI